MPAETLDAPPLERAFQLARGMRHREAFATRVDAYADDRSPCEQRFEVASDRFDFRQLRHRRSAGASPRRFHVAPRVAGLLIQDEWHGQLEGGHQPARDLAYIVEFLAR